MFMDAMLYTSVSHNLAQGIGSFWFPQFSLHNVAGLPSFHEQPPLVFGMQAVFFQLVGDNMYIERLYTFLTMCITAWLMVQLWKSVFRNHAPLQRLGWLPLILWISIPVCFWSYSNNMHENTMGIFTLASVLLAYKAFQKEKFPWVLLVASGIAVFLATFSKGIPGFFPITAPFLYWLATRKINFAKVVQYTLVITLVPILIYGLLFLFPESRESLSVYFFKRALHRINDLPTVDSRFYIFWRIFMEILPQVAVVLVFLLIRKIRKQKISLNENGSEIIFFLLLGFAASAPLMLTLVQKGFYFVPSLPFFAVGLAMIIAPFVSEGIENMSMKFNRIAFVVASVLLVSSIVFTVTQKGKFSRNKDLLQDIYLIGTVAPHYSAISVPGALWNNWDMQCSLMRYYNISFDPGFAQPYCVIEKNTVEIPAGYQKVEIATKQFDLYRKM